MEQEGQDSAVALPGRRIDQGPLSADGVGEEPGLLRAEDRQGHRTEIGAEGTREAPDAVCSSPEAVIHSRSMTNGYTPGSKLIAHGGQNSTRADSLGILRQMERVDPDAQRLAGAIVSTPSWEGARMPPKQSPAGIACRGRAAVLCRPPLFGRDTLSSLRPAKHRRTSRLRIYRRELALTVRKLTRM